MSTILPLSRQASDAALVRRVRAGDDTAFEALHARHRPAVRQYVARMLNDAVDVDDVVQDVFSRAFVRFRSDWDGRDSVLPWLLRVARNRAIDTVRAARPTTELVDEHPAPGELADAVALRGALASTLAALRGLPAGQRRALVLHAVHGEPYCEIARRLDVSAPAAKALAFRGRDHLRRRLAA